MTLVVTSACEPPGPPGSAPTATVVSHGGPVQDQPSLIDALRAAGLTVNPTGTVSQPFLAGSGTVLNVGGEDVQVYEYASSAAAQGDAAKIQPDGSVNGSIISWIAQPHFYNTGKIIVIYPGTNDQILAALEAALGKPFAVGPTSASP